MKTDPANPSHDFIYRDEDAEEFRKFHGYKHGCQMGRTAGSATLECDTHQVVLSLDIPVLLRDI
jgi:extradiol dioxygenase family protein